MTTKPAHLVQQVDPRVTAQAAEHDVANMTAGNDTTAAPPVAGEGDGYGAPTGGNDTTAAPPVAGEGDGYGAPTGGNDTTTAPPVAGEPLANATVAPPGDVAEHEGEAEAPPSPYFPPYDPAGAGATAAATPQVANGTALTEAQKVAIDRAKKMDKAMWTDGF